MSSPEVRIVVSVPNGFTPSDAAPPDLTQSPQLAVEQWESARDGSGATLVWGCIGADVSAWNADATELAQDKLVELASKTPGKALHAVRTSADGRQRALASEDSLATARTLLAFTPDRAHACIAACTAPECTDAVARATIAGGTVDPPAPGLALSTLSYAVHHPHQALAGLGGLLFLAAALAIATRPGKRKTKRSHS